MRPSTAWHYLLLLWLMGSLCSLYAAPADRSSFRISAVPLTTKPQMQQGVEGGEGFQLVMSIVYSPSNPSVVYLASDTSQVWKSIDGGNSWVPKNSGYIALGSRSLFVHPRDENIVFSAGSFGKTFKRAGKKKPYQGIYRSLDGGDHWEMVHQVPFYKQASRGSLFAIDSRTLDDTDFTLFAGAFNGDLLISKDSGASWRTTGAKIGRIFEIVELPAVPGTLLVASDQGLHRYDGKRLRKVGIGLPTWPRSIAVSPDRPTEVFAALGEKGIYKSVDGGENFRQVSNVARLFGAVNDIEVSPVDADIAIFTKSGKAAGPYYTHDGGRNWKAAKTINARGLTKGGGFFFASPVAMHPTEAMTTLTSSNSKARVLITHDGGERWSYSSSGYRGGRLTDVVSISSKKMIFNLTDHGAWRTSDRGESFEPIKHPRKGGRSVGGGAMSGDTLVLAVGSWKTKQLLVSHDRGQSWIDTKLNEKLRLVQAHNTQKQLFYAGPFRSDDKGRTWKKLKYVIAGVDPADNDTVYALKNSKRSAQLLVSKDRGSHWQSLGAPLPSKTKRASGIEVDPFISSRLYVATANGVWIFGGNKWHLKGASQGLLRDNFRGKFVETVMAHSRVPGLLFAGRRSPGKGMGNGLFYSIDHGDNWQPMPDSDLNNSNIWSVNENPYNGDVYVGTSHGIYRIEVLVDLQ